MYPDHCGYWVHQKGWLILHYVHQRSDVKWCDVVCFAQPAISSFAVHETAKAEQADAHHKTISNRFNELQTKYGRYDLFLFANFPWWWMIDIFLKPKLIWRQFIPTMYPDSTIGRLFSSSMMVCWLLFVFLFLSSSLPPSTSSTGCTDWIRLSTSDWRIRRHFGRLRSKPLLQMWRRRMSNCTFWRVFSSSGPISAGPTRGEGSSSRFLCISIKVRYAPRDIKQCKYQQNLMVAIHMVHYVLCNMYWLTYEINSSLNSDRISNRTIVLISLVDSNVYLVETATWKYPFEKSSYSQLYREVWNTS